jgi:tRNA(Ile)-lysidine synthetase-like protein
MATRDGSQPADLVSNRATSTFERRVARALGAHLGAGRTLLAACSGGPDSTAALIAVARAAAAAGGEAVAANFDHGTRIEAETAADRAYVEALAQRLGIRALAGSARAAEGAEGAEDGSEAAAREARYRWLAAATREAGAAACVTGHTRDDQAETVLLRLTRGAGLSGAAAMTADAAWPVEAPAPAAASGGPAPRLLRPLLEVGRAEVLAYLDALGLAGLGLTPRSDPTNERLGFDRNRVTRRSRRGPSGRPRGYCASRRGWRASIVARSASCRRRSRCG